MVAWPLVSCALLWKRPLAITIGAAFAPSVLALIASVGVEATARLSLTVLLMKSLSGRKAYQPLATIAMAASPMTAVRRCMGVLLAVSCRASADAYSAAAITASRRKWFPRAPARRGWRRRRRAREL